MYSTNTTKRFLVGIVLGSIVAIAISVPVMMLLKWLNVSLPMHFFAIAIALSIVMWAFRWSHRPNG